MELTILGTSSALPTSERHPSAHVLNVHERFFLIDCGEGTQMQMRKAKIRFNKINNIFISHLHGDHLFGIYGLLSSFSLMGRTASLNIYAPENLSSLLLSHLNDFGIVLGFDLTFIPLTGKTPQMIFENKFMTVDSFPLNHRIPAYGFLFREKEKERNIIKEAITEYNIPVVRIPAIKKGEDFICEDGRIIKNEDITVRGKKPMSFAYCSDTKYTPAIASYVKGVDVLYHEATYEKQLSDLAAKTAHSTTVEAADIAKKAGVGKLLIGHFSSRYKNVDILEQEAREVFPNTEAARELKTYIIDTDS